MELMGEIESLKDDRSALEQQLGDRSELLVNYVERDKQHQTLRSQWESEQRRFTETIDEMKQTAVKMTETLLTQRNENQQLQESAVRHSLAVIQDSQKMDKLNQQVEELEAVQLAQTSNLEACAHGIRALVARSNLLY